MPVMELSCPATSPAADWPSMSHGKPHMKNTMYMYITEWPVNYYCYSCVSYHACMAGSMSSPISVPK